MEALETRIFTFVTDTTIWQNQMTNIQEGDIVLLRKKSIAQNDWPIGLVTQVFESEDNLVRKVEVRIMKDGKQTSYVRPIVELVALV